MHRDEAPALRGTWLGVLLRLLNRPMRLALGSPLHWPLSCWFVLISWVGPKTGKRHVIPVSYVVEDGDVYATTGDHWWRSAIDAAEVSVTLRGHKRRAQITPVEAGERSAVELERLFGRHKFFRRLAGIPAAADGRPDPVAVRRSVDAGRALLRIDVGLAGEQGFEP
jgi:hypothetical protein